MAGAEYHNLKLCDLNFVNGGLRLNDKDLSTSETLIESFGRVFNVKNPDFGELIWRLRNEPNRAVILYTVGNRALALFDPKDPIFTPNDSLALKNRLLSEKWLVPHCKVTAKETHMLVFGTEMYSAFSGDGGILRLGVMLTIPHTATAPILLQTAVQRVLSSTVLVLKDRDSTIKTSVPEGSEPLNWIYRATKGAVNHFAGSMAEWVLSRWKTVRGITASLEECLKVLDKTKDKAKGMLNPDDLLTKHGLLRVSDKWSMYRRQANTPFTRLDLVNVMAEYALHSEDPWKAMADAGVLLVERGDLESRPAWLEWNCVDRSNEKNFLSK
jgi:hypothetical protein